MNRRTFTQLLAAAPIGLRKHLGAPGLDFETWDSTSLDQFSLSLSVMLWTVFRKLPFEERIAKVAEAGYTNVELVGEYSHWSQSDFDRANAARKRLGIRFDATAGLPHGIADPANREAFLADLRQAFTPMESLACPAMIVLTGNVVPGLSREAQHQSCIEALSGAPSLIKGPKTDARPIRLLLKCIDLEENPHYFL